MIIRGNLEGEPPSKVFWYDVKRDERGNPIMYQYVKSKWIHDNISALRLKKHKRTAEPIDIEVNFILKNDRKISELLSAIEFIFCNTFIDDTMQIRNITLTKELSNSDKKTTHQFIIKTT